jgi:hypothetical protein
VAAHLGTIGILAVDGSVAVIVPKVIASLDAAALARHQLAV